MTEDRQTISLLEMAREGSIGPVQIGRKLSDFALELGPPVRWGDFSDRKRLSCIMVFGDVEVGFEGQKNDAVVIWAKFWMHGFRRRRLPFAKNEMGKTISIENPFASKFPSYDSVVKVLRENKIRFSRGFTEPVGSETTAVLNLGRHLKFYFTGARNPKLTVICLS